MNPPSNSFKFKPDKHVFVFIDTEFTNGDEPKTGLLLEIGVIITDCSLQPIDYITIQIHHSQEVLDKHLNDWHREKFEENGLLKEIAESKITSYSEAQDIIIERIRTALHKLRGPDATWEGAGTQNIKRPIYMRLVPAGNSVHKDLEYLQLYMNTFFNMLHRRACDVSLILMLSRLWLPPAFTDCEPKRIEPLHRAANDIQSSLNLLQYFRFYLYAPFWPKEPVEKELDQSSVVEL